MQKTGELTPSEQRWLQHLRRPEKQGVTLVDYARSAGVKVGSLYEARHTIARKGIQVRGAAEDSPRKSAEFITVQVEPSTVAVAGEPVCRLRHAGGWVLECTNWPTATGWRRSSVEVHMIRPDRALTRVYLHRAPVDFRKQHQGLAALVQEALGVDPFSGSVFGFINKRRTKLRLSVWEKNGFVL